MKWLLAPNIWYCLSTPSLILLLVFDVGFGDCVRARRCDRGSDRNSAPTKPFWPGPSGRRLLQWPSNQSSVMLSSTRFSFIAATQKIYELKNQEVAYLCIMHIAHKKGVYFIRIIRYTFYQVQLFINFVKWNTCTAFCMLTFFTV